MRALLCDAEPRLVRDHTEPRRAPGEALIAVRVAGICDTDLQLARGYMGFRGVLGHEFVGDVVESSDPALRGRRVVADINAGCGVCLECRARGGHHCAERSVLGILRRDGAIADRLVMPERCLVPVPDAVDDDAAVFAEPLAAALHAIDEIPVGAVPVVVLGDGKLGQLVARASLSTGKRTIVIGHHEDKLALARAAGAEAVLERDVGSELRGVPAVVEATGSTTGLALALSLVRPRGSVILKTTVAGATSVDLSPVVINELRLVGSRCGSLERAIEALLRGRADPTPLIAARYPLDRAEEAMRHAAQRGTLKVLVDA
jgi:threonine dehydrogenase-like Zn-dependent dehydrogenase